ncbi:MAG: hypothetical protein ABFD15_01785 [Methanofastidiosum sp.]
MIYTGRFEINPATLHVERVNAMSMIEGFEKNNKKYYLSILTAHKRAKSLVNNFQKVPKLITNHIQENPKSIYPLSSIGVQLHSEKYTIDKKYVAIVDTIYPIKNTISLWEKICSSDIFDIWKPDAPFESVRNKKDPQIMLIRVCEINQDMELSITKKTDRYLHVHPEEVTLKKFILNNNEFNSIRNKIELILEKEYGKSFESRKYTDTSKIKI